MESHLWLKESFSVNLIPDWPCPTCGKALLNIDKDQFNYSETPDSARSHTHEDWDPELISYRFTGNLRCSNQKCMEIVTFIGTGGIELNTYNDYRGIGETKWEEYFIPKYFVPALHLFRISKKCPVEVAAQIVDAFNLYWSDASACSNKIRIALEMIMDDQGIKKTRINQKTKERKPLPLHGRIDLFGKKFPLIKDHLLAIKWIGNSGSHVGKLERIDLIDAFILLEYSVEKLYDDKEKILQQISKQIIKSKRPRHSRKRSRKR